MLGSFLDIACSLSLLLMHFIRPAVIHGFIFVFVLVFFMDFVLLFIMFVIVDKKVFVAKS